MFLHNAWYVAAWDRELTRTPLARLYLDEPVVLFRTEDGTPVALEDRCCHHHMPLSRGRLIGDRMQCGYHGLEFDATGACVKIPAQSRIPPGARVRAYPVVEKWQWVWIWMGDPARADPALIPNYWWADHPEWAVSKPEPFHLQCNYQLVTDNVLDVTHLVYVHQTSIGNAAISDFPVKTEVKDGTVRMTRWIIDRPAPPMYQAAGKFAGNVDRWQIVEHVPPCHSVNFAGCAPTGTGAPEGNRSKGIELLAVSAPTPETVRTTHYFFHFARKFGLGDPAMEKVFTVDFVDVFKEDVAVFEAQQRTMDRTRGAPQIDINVDAAPLAARRLLTAMIEKEQLERLSQAAE
jgi:phenylpropionate dioxygenase-like ring-hydroxylating dioxygenase large terminal subunit